MNWNWHRQREVLPERALAAEARLGAIKKAAKKFKNSVEESLKTAPNKNRGEDPSVRKRRTAEFTLGDNVAASVHFLNEEKVAMNLPQPVVSPLNTVLERFANLEKTLGHMVAVNEGDVATFMCSDTPLSRLLAEDVPAAASARKDLEALARKHSQCQGTLDKEQRRLDKMMLAAAASEEEVVDADALAQQREKKERTAHELEILSKELSLEQDRLSSTLLTLVSRENRYAQSVYELMRIKKQFYENAFRTIEAELPNIARLLEETNIRPVFGEQLEDHLRSTGRTIAYPIALSVAYLLESGLTDEGLFRISAKQVKLDKFKACLDSRMPLAELLAESNNDPHLYASLLKSYLRELPVPLLGGGRAYDRWIEAARIPDEKRRLEAFKDILQTEHTELSAINAQYVLKFLHVLATNSSETKMTPRNISIVLGPTLLWADRSCSEMEHSNLENVIGLVAALIENYEHIFLEDIDLDLADDEDLAELRMDALKISEASSSVFNEMLPSGSSCLAPPSMYKTSYPTESPSPSAKRKPSIRGVGSKFMNNPVGRNIMSKINSSASAVVTSSYASSSAKKSPHEESGGGDDQHPHHHQLEADVKKP